MMLMTLLLLALPAEPAPLSPMPAVVARDLDTAHQLGAMLRCPVCQGMPISESPAQMAQDMMTRVRDMLREGKSRQQILDYFVARYGEWVLLEPKAEGLNLTLWILPLAALAFGFSVVLRRLRAAPAAAGAATGDAAAATNAPTDEEYLAALRDEVRQ
jgi:cytochrome c-type biogenesis protein CcmH